MSLFDRRLLGREILPGYGYYLAVLAWMLLVLPWQVRTLGPDQWPIVAFCLSLHALLFGLDLALSPLLLQAAGARTEPGFIGFLYLHAHARCRNAALLLAMAMLLLLAIGRHFGLTAPLTPSALLLMLALYLLQIQNAVALAIWNGRGQQALASGRSAAFLLVRHAFASLFIAAGAASAEVFLFGLVLGAGLEWQTNRRILLRQYPPDSGHAAGTGQSLTLLPWALASAALALLSTQFDRLWLGVQIDSADFGTYVLIGTPLAAYLSLQMPIQRSLLPRLSRPESAPAAMRAVWQAHALLAVPCLLAAPVSDWLLHLWLGPLSPALALAPVLSALLFALAAAILTAPAFLWLMHQRRWPQLLLAQCLTLVLQAWWLSQGRDAAPFEGAIRAAFMPGLVGLSVILLHPALLTTLLRGDKRR
ncbi:MAG: hypothetical protein IPK97_08720 [Ahniella sp.]|nr:hypothetical protein [Ahniella sp.]